LRVSLRSETASLPGS